MSYIEFKKQKKGAKKFVHQWLMANCTVACSTWFYVSILSLFGCLAEFVYFAYQ